MIVVSVQVLEGYFLKDGRPFIAGNEVSIADFAMVPPLKFFEVTDFEVPAAMKAYLARFEQAVPAWREMCDGMGSFGLNAFMAMVKSQQEVRLFLCVLTIVAGCASS